MQPEQFLLPTIATLALGTALLVPLRDDRLGKRATLGAMRPSIGDRIRKLLERANTPDIERDVVIERSFAQTLDVLMPVPETAIRPESPVEPETVAVDEAPRTDVSGAAYARVIPLRAGIRPDQTRVVPLTRMPLRPQTGAITWTQECVALAATATRAERHDVLARAASTDRANLLEPNLIRAYREEDAAGRLLALRALANGSHPGAFDCFVDALSVGTDDERAFAIDALLAVGRPDALSDALCDRVDAIAASAALGFVGTTVREDYVRKLAPFIDRSRIDALLVLLAGIFE